MTVLEFFAVGEKLRIVDRSSLHQQLERLAGVLPAKVLRSEEGSIMHKRCHQIQKEFAIDVLPQISAGDCSIERRSDSLTRRLDQSSSKTLAELRLLCTLGIQGAESLGANPPICGEKDREALVNVAQSATRIRGHGNVQPVGKSSED